MRDVGRPDERRLARDVAHEVGAFHVRNRAGLAHQLARVDIARGDHAAHDAGRSQQPRQLPRVDVGNRDDVVGDEIVAERARRAPVAGDRRLLAHDEAGNLRHGRFDVVGRHAVVADLRRGHRDDLSGVRRIGQHFLIAGHARVEHDFAARDALRAGRRAAIHRPVLQRQNSIHGIYFLSNDAATLVCSPAPTRTVVVHGW